MSVYYITEVRTDSNKVITDLNTRKDNPKAGAVSMTKSALIKLLKPLGNDTAKTHTATASEKIRVIDGKYLRTDSNDTKEDNLGNLPSF